MQRVIQIVSNLPESKWLFRIAKITFFLWATSLVLSVVFSWSTGMVFGPNASCMAWPDDFGLGFSCEGFMYASVIETLLQYSVNFWTLALFIPVLVLFAFFMTQHPLRFSFICP